MNLAGKDLKEYIDVLKIPIAVSIALYIVGAVISIVNGVMGVALGPLGACVGVFTGLGFFVISIVLGIALAVYVGQQMAKKKAANLMQCAAAGAVFGLIVGIIGGLANVFGAVVNIATSIGTFGINVVIALLALFVGPVLSIIIGAACAALGGHLAGAKGK
ncbi:MAG: hypothetical protein PHG85_00905 [Candidatus Altiarchaeota archaeon]|nr:hypothetical protein [Candidatus Altiarchaeota archaeon]